MAPPAHQPSLSPRAGGVPADTQAARKQENQILLMNASFQGDIGIPHPTLEPQGELVSFNV